MMPGSLACTCSSIRWAARAILLNSKLRQCSTYSSSSFCQSILNTPAVSRVLVRGNFSHSGCPRILQQMLLGRSRPAVLNSKLADMKSGHAMTFVHSVQVKPVYTYVHSQHHQIGSAITPLGTAFGDAMDIGLCFVAYHLVLGAYLYYQPAWNIAAVVLLIVFEVGVLLNKLGLHTCLQLAGHIFALSTTGRGIWCTLYPTLLMHLIKSSPFRFTKSI